MAARPRRAPRSSSSSRVLPMPGSPSSGDAGGAALVERVESRLELLRAPFRARRRAGGRVHRSAPSIRGFRVPVQGAGPMFRGRRGRRLHPCSRTPTEGATCNSHGTSQRAPDAGAPGIARPPFSAGSCSWSWPSWWARTWAPRPSPRSSRAWASRAAPSKITTEAYPDKLGESVLIQSKSLKTDAPEYRAVVADVRSGSRTRRASRRSMARTARASSQRRPPTTAIRPGQLRGQG